MSKIVTPDEQEPRLIPVCMIEQSEELSFREKTDQETIDRYSELWVEYKEEQAKTDEVLKPPFPPIAVFETGEEKYAVVAGVHRWKSAQKAEIAEILCIVLTDRKEAILRGARDNHKHGLRSSKGDLRQCIKVVKKEFGEKSNREIAKLLGCSHTYVNRICNELEVETVSTPTDQGTNESDDIIQESDEKSLREEKGQAAMDTSPASQNVAPTPEDVGNTQSVETKIEKINGKNEVVFEERNEATDNATEPPETPEASDAFEPSANDCGITHQLIAPDIPKDFEWYAKGLIECLAADANTDLPTRCHALFLDCYKLMDSDQRFRFVAKFSVFLQGQGFGGDSSIDAAAEEGSY